MDWVAKAIKLKNNMTWDEVAAEISEIMGERYGSDKVRKACRKRVAKIEDPEVEREAEEEIIPLIQEDNDSYTITPRNKEKDPVFITKNKLRDVKKMYCNKPYPTMNECARELDIPREDFYLILKAFKITHSDVPFIDEDLVEREIEDLAFESLEYQKQQFVKKFDELEVKELRKEIAKYRKEDYFIDKAREAVEEHMKDFNKSYKGPPPAKKVVEDGYMLEVPIVDLHLGKLAWLPETGENYDYKIARQRYNHVIDDVYDRANERPIEKILFPISNDFFHFDTVETTTTAGTPQDSDMRWPKLYSIGVEMLITSLDKFASIAPVEVLVVPGNHDRMTGYYAILHLSAWYRNVDNVNVHVDPKTRKYFEHGNVLIGYSHGDKEKGRIWDCMQVESPKAWARTKYREWHLAHEHAETSKEKGGILLRRLSSLTGTDAWHFEMGYVGALARQQCFLWNKEKGLHEIWVTPIT